MLTTQSQIDSFCQHLYSLQSLLEKSFQRRMVVLAGSEQWCLTCMASFVLHNKTDDTLLISDVPCLSVTYSRPAIKLNQLLGQEYDTIIWNGFSNLNPDALGIASGLLKGGGLFFLLLPEFNILVAKGDPDYLRMCADDAVFERCHRFFLQRLITHLQADPSIIIYEQQADSYALNTNEDVLAAVRPQLPTQDQEQALDVIYKVAKGHRYRPLVLQADRGRGKSSILGIAAARLYIEQGYAIAITAPNKQTCLPAFRHYQQVIEAHFACPDAIATALAAFQFVPMDQLTEHCNQFHLFMVDEAAAISSYILQTLLGQHPRLVFATTLHGYEGHGQGFAIRFKQILDAQTPQWRSVSLKTPVRWLENDPLEAWFFRFLLLDARISSVDSCIDSSIGEQIFPELSHTGIVANGDSVQIHWLNQATLAQQARLFESAFALLVSAHYQTKPSDIRLILDHPHIRIALAVSASDASWTSCCLLGVLLVLEEGGLSPHLADAIIAGNRRPRGDLFPQALCASTGDAAFLVQRSYRITRIAVHADHRHCGVGSALLDAARTKAQENKIDSLSSSFGLRPELLTFWGKNHFNIVKLGLHADGASGSQSIMLMHALSKRATSLQEQTTRTFSQHFVFNLNRQYQSLPIHDCLAILQNIAPVVHIDVDSEFDSSDLAMNNIQAFAFAHRPYEASNLAIFQFVLSQLRHKNWQALGKTAEGLLIMKVLQAHDNLSCQKQFKLKGKKELNQRLRSALQVLLVDN